MRYSSRYAHACARKAAYRLALAAGKLLAVLVVFVYAEPLSVLLGLAALMLLLASVNVGGLFLARAVAREHEFCVQMALGAVGWHSRLRFRRQR